MTDLMAIVPHPDDEVFGLGGAWARTAADGGRSVLVTLTRGRGGRTLGLCPPRELGDVRERELREAAARLGIGELVLFDHHDFVPDDDRGLPRDPGLQALAPAGLERELARTIDRVQPRALVTFGANGSNGHPDHVTTHRLVHGALRRARHRPAAIYHYAAPEPYDGPARPGFLAPERIRALHVPVSHRLVLTREELEVKLAAMACHRSQALSVLAFMKRLTGRLFEETFARVDVDGRPLAADAAPATVERL
jgi:LmbE family N-acetylglucosaminyl deacetylase